MKFTICHDTGKKTLAIPRAVLQLSGLEDAERLTIYETRGCVALTRQEPSAGERLETVQLLHDLSVSMLARLALDSRGADGGPSKRAARSLRARNAEFLDMLERCGVDLAGLAALLEREAADHG